MEKIRIWHGQKERYDVVALSCYGGRLRRFALW